MKRVILRDRGQFKARDVITAMLEQPAQVGAGITYADMRKRDRVLAALEQYAGKNYFDLEDADHATLRAILETFPWATGKRELRQILDDIANAKSPEETPELKLVDNAG